MHYNIVFGDGVGISEPVTVGDGHVIRFLIHVGYG